MNAKTGKLLILGGFGLKALVAGIDFLIQLIMLFMPLASNGTISSILNIIATLAIAGGFAIMFLLKPNMFDLAIGGSMALTLVPSFFYLINYYMFINGKYSEIMNNYTAIYSIMSILGYFGIIALLAWELKLNKSGNKLAGIAVAAAIAAIFICDFIARFNHVLVIIAALGYVAAYAACAFAALLDSGK